VDWEDQGDWDRDGDWDVDEVWRGWRRSPVPDSLSGRMQSPQK